jgi:hypothetical protein
VVAAELHDFFRKIADPLRVFYRGTLYRRRGGIRGLPGAPHHRVARPRGHPRCPRVWPTPGPPPALVQSSSFIREK